MNEYFVPFEIAKKLKEKGFNEDCYTVYNTATMRIERSLTTWKGYKGVILAPTISQVLKWLREEKRIDAGAVWDNRDGKWVGYINEMDMPNLVGEYVLPNTYNSYELAAIGGIEYIIDNNLI